MTVDVEDYFHVSAFDAVVSRAEWNSFESRVVPNTEMLLELFGRANVRATFFVLGWVAERFPALVRRIASLGHEVASHGYHHQLLYMLTPDQFRDDIRRAKAVDRERVGSDRARLSGAQLFGDSVEPVGHRRTDRRRLHVRRERLSDSSRSLRHSRRAAPSACVRTGAGLVDRISGVDGAAARHEPADCRRRLFPADAVRMDALGHRPREPRRATSRWCFTRIHGKSIRNSRVCRLDGRPASGITAASRIRVGVSSGCCATFVSTRFRPCWQWTPGGSRDCDRNCCRRPEATNAPH